MRIKDLECEKFKTTKGRLIRNIYIWISCCNLNWFLKREYSQLKWQSQRMPRPTSSWKVTNLPRSLSKYVSKGFEESGNDSPVHLKICKKQEKRSVSNFIETFLQKENKVKSIKDQIFRWLSKANISNVYKNLKIGSSTT